MVKKSTETWFDCEVCRMSYDSLEEAELCEAKGVKDYTTPIGTLVTNEPMDVIFRVKEHGQTGHKKYNVVELLNGRTMGGSDFREARFSQIKKLREWLEITMPMPGEVVCPKCGKVVSPKWLEEALRRQCNEYDHGCGDEGFDEEFE